MDTLKMMKALAMISVGAAGLLAAAGGACGQCSVYRLDVQDLDQRRTIGINTAGLPGGGSSHCVPTAAANWLAYIGTHGYPEVLAPRNWQQNGASYGAATSLIDQLGVLMGTSTSGGTSYGTCSTVVQQGLDQASPGNFVSYAVSINGNYAPSSADIYFGMITGQLVSIGSSRWALTPADPVLQLPQRYVRSKGGHAMTVNRVYNACTFSPTIYIRDPAGPNDGQTVSQSQFETFPVSVAPSGGVFAETDTTTTLNTRVVSRLIDPANTVKFSVVNTLMVISPKLGLTANAQQGQFNIMNMHHPDDFSVLPVHTHTSPNSVPVVAMKMHPQVARVLMLTSPAGQDPALTWFTPGTGTFDPIGPLPGATGIAFGRNGELYARTSTHMLRLDASTTPATQNGSVAVAGVAAIAYDDRSDTVVAVAPSRGVLGFSSASRFPADYAEMPVPAGVTIAGATSCAVSPLDSTIWLASTGDDALYSLSKGGAGVLVLNQRVATGQTIAPKNLHVDHRGHVVFTSGGVVRELRQNVANGQWEADPTSKFAGTVAGDIFEQSAARSNTDDTLTPLNEGQDTPNQPEVGGVMPILDCRPDFNGDGTLSVQDIFDFLNGWFNGNLRTDFNFSGTRNVQDIFDFLGAWFAGC